MKSSRARDRSGTAGLSVSLAAIAVVVWCVATLAVAAWLPKIRKTRACRLRRRADFWMPLGVSLGLGLGRARAHCSLAWTRLAFSAGCHGIGLAISAAVAAALMAAQLLPVIEFMQQTDRAARAHARSIGSSPAVPVGRACLAQYSGSSLRGQ